MTQLLGYIEEHNRVPTANELFELVQIEHFRPVTLEQLNEYADEFLGQDISDGSFILTIRLAVYYLDVMRTVLWDDREFFEELSTIAAIESQDVDRIVRFIEDEIKFELHSRVGTVYPSEQELLDELFGVLEALQQRAQALLLN